MKNTTLSLFAADDLAKRKQIEELVKTWDSRPNSNSKWEKNGHNNIKYISNKETDKMK